MFPVAVVFHKRKFSFAATLGLKIHNIDNRLNKYVCFYESSITLMNLYAYSHGVMLGTNAWFLDNGCVKFKDDYYFYECDKMVYIKDEGFVCLH